MPAATWIYVVAGEVGCRSPVVQLLRKILAAGSTRPSDRPPTAKAGGVGSGLHHHAVTDERVAGGEEPVTPT
jgi:hypothetical protein